MKKQHISVQVADFLKKKEFLQIYFSHQDDKSYDLTGLFSLVTEYGNDKTVIEVRMYKYLHSPCDLMLRITLSSFSDSTSLFWGEIKTLEELKTVFETTLGYLV